MKTASIATFTPRREALRLSVESLIPQMDVINVYLNDYDEVPDFLGHPKVNALLGKDAEGDLLASAKFFWCPFISEGYHFTCDDDLYYPDDYAERMIAEVDRWRGKAIVTAHAFRYKAPFDSVLCHDAFACLTDTTDAWVHIPGTGVMCYDASVIQIPRDDFCSNNTEDWHLGVGCQKREVPVRVIAHSKEWIGYHWDGPTIWASEYAAGYPKRREVLKSWPEWTLYSVDDDGNVVEGETIAFEEKTQPTRRLLRKLIR